MTDLSTLARYVVVAAVWPPLRLADRLRGVDTPASWRAGVEWAQGKQHPTIRTADRPAVVRRRSNDIELLMDQIIADHEAVYRGGRPCPDGDIERCANNANRQNTNP